MTYFNVENSEYKEAVKVEEYKGAIGLVDAYMKQDGGHGDKWVFPEKSDFNEETKKYNHFPGDKTIPKKVVLGYSKEEAKKMVMDIFEAIDAL